MITLIPVATNRSHTDQQANDIERRCQARGCVMVTIKHPDGTAMLAAGYHSNNLQAIKALMHEFGTIESMVLADTPEVAAMLQIQRRKRAEKPEAN